MLAYLSLALSVAAMPIVLGWPPLPTGHWPGISLGLAATLAGVLELRRNPKAPRARALSWLGASTGLLAALLGIAVYLGWIVAASRVG